MPRFRRRSFRRGRGGFRRARRFVRRTVANMGLIHVNRVLCDELSIPAKTTNAWDNPLAISLIKCQETVDEEIEADGTNPTECYPGDSVVALKLKAWIHGNLTSASLLRWMIVKRPDGETLIANTTSLITAFHSSNDTASDREWRANILAKGILNPSTGDAKSGLNFFVKRKTLKRLLGYMRENDSCSLLIATNGASAHTITIMGGLYVRHK